MATRPSKAVKPASQRSRSAASQRSRSAASPQPRAAGKPPAAAAGKPPAAAAGKPPAAAAGKPRQPEPASQPQPAPAAQPARPRPWLLKVAAAALATEAAGMCVATAFAAVSTADGKSYQLASGVALTLIALGTAALLAVLAMGLARARPWSRTPAVMVQLFTGGAGIYLLDGHRYDWGVPALLVTAACLAAILAPDSLRALNRPGR